MTSPRIAVALGDSLMHAPYPQEYGATNLAVGIMSALPQQFVNAYGAPLPASRFEWRDYAVSGHTTADCIATQLPAVLALNPRWALIMFGTNDWDELSLAEYQANLRTIWNSCRAQDCEPIMLTPPPFFYASPPPVGYTTRVRRPYLIETVRDAAIVQAELDGVPYLDLYDLMADLYDSITIATAWNTLGNEVSTSGVDRTHWILAGATAAANYITAELPTLSPSLASYLLTLYSEPSFATLEQLKRAAGVTVTTWDTDLQLILNGVTASVKAWIGRNIALKRYTSESHSLSVPNTKLRLNHRPIVSVVEVRLDGETVPQADYEIQLDEGVLYNEGGWPAGTYHLEVDYTAGYVTVPISLRDAVIAQSRYVWTQYKNGPDRFGLAQRAEASGGSTAFVVQDWYPGVLAAMRAYQRLA